MGEKDYEKLLNLSYERFNKLVDLSEFFKLSPGLMNYLLEKPDINDLTIQMRCDYRLDGVNKILERIKCSNSNNKKESMEEFLFQLDGYCNLIVHENFRVDRYIHLMSYDRIVPFIKFYSSFKFLQRMSQTYNYFTNTNEVLVLYFNKSSNPLAYELLKIADKRLKLIDCYSKNLNSFVSIFLSHISQCSRHNDLKKLNFFEEYFKITLHLDNS